MTISVNRVATHIGLPKNHLPDSSASEAELSSVQMGCIWCQSMAYRHVYDLIFKISWAYIRIPLLHFSEVHKCEKGKRKYSKD